MFGTRPRSHPGARPKSLPSTAEPSARGRLAVATFGAILLAASLVGPAAAASVTRTASIDYSGTGAPGYSFDVKGVCDKCIPDAVSVILGSGSWAYGVTATAFVDHRPGRPSMTPSASSSTTRTCARAGPWT